MKQDFALLLLIAICIPIVVILSNRIDQPREIIVEPTIRIFTKPDTTFIYEPGAKMKWRNDSIFTDSTYTEFVRILKKSEIK